MAKKKNVCGVECKTSGGFYFLGFIGALIYYLTTTTGFWNVVLGILKSFVWPVFLVYEVLHFVGA